MSSNIPEMLGEMDQAIRDIWQRHIESLTPTDFMDFLDSSTTYFKLVKLRNDVDECLGLLDALRLKLLPLLPAEEPAKEN